MTEESTNDAGGERLSNAEIGKDAIQSTLEAAATTLGEVATIVTAAVRDVGTALGDFANRAAEIREASRWAAEGGGAHRADAELKPPVED
jgi:hypothetical protein